MNSATLVVTHCAAFCCGVIALAVWAWVTKRDDE